MFKWKAIEDYISLELLLFSAWSFEEFKQNTNNSLVGAKIT